MAPKQRSPDDIHDIFNVQVGKPYRGSLVEKIDIETTDLPSGKVKVRRLIYCDSGIILIEDTWHEYGEVYKDGKLLPYDQINFPSMDPSDFEAPVPKKDDDDDDEKKKKRELLRQKAKEMMKPKPAPKNVIPDDDDDDDDDDGNDDLRIKVKTPDGETIPIVMKKDDTLDDLKDKIEDDHGIPADDYNLNLNGKPLERPKSSLDDCGVKDGDVLELDPVDKTFTVCLRTPDGEKYDIDIDPAETVKDLKQMIENDLGIPASTQNLSCRGKTLNDPLSTMADNGISNGDIIDLDMAGISVNVLTPDGRRLTIPARKDTTVKDLKKSIEQKEGIPVKDQNLAFEGARLDDPYSTMADNGISDGDTLELNLNGDNDKKDRTKSKPMSGTSTAPKGNDRKRVLSPNSAWVYPKASTAPKEGEIDNLQGIWSMPPAKGSGTEPVEVNIHPKHKEPKSDGKTDIHGAYGYINGAKPDADGVVDPKNVVFYPPGQKDYSPDFEHIGWWSAPESHSTTTISWRFEGDDCLNVKTHTVNVMGHEVTFVKEWID